MANPNLHLSVINDGASYERREHAALKHIEGSSSAIEYRQTMRDICRQVAASERAKFGTTTTNTDLKKCTDEVCRYSLAHAWEYFDMQSGTAIQATIRRWFDKVNGNSYFSARVTVTCSDGKNRSFLVPFQYGYGSYPEWVIWDTLIERRILPDPGRYANGSRIGCLSDAPIHFEDQGFMQKNRMFGA